MQEGMFTLSFFSLFALLEKESGLQTPALAKQGAPLQGSSLGWAPQR